MQSFQEPCDFQSSAVEVFYLQPHHTSLIRQGEREGVKQSKKERVRVLPSLLIRQWTAISSHLSFEHMQSHID